MHSVLSNGRTGPKAVGKSKRLSKAKKRDQWTEWYYYPGHCTSPLDALASSSAFPSLPRPVDIDGANTLTFWTLSQVSPPRRASMKMGPPAEETWRLGVAILDAEEGDRRVKGIRERLYPGSVIQLDPDLIDIDIDRIGSLPLHPSESQADTSTHTARQPPSQGVIDGDNGSGLFGHSGTRYPSDGSITSTLPLTLGRSIRHSQPMLVSGLQRSTGVRPEEERAAEGPEMPIRRIAFRYDPQPDDPDLLPVWKRVHWGRWVDKVERREFAEEVVKRVEEIFEGPRP